MRTVRLQQVRILSEKVSCHCYKKPSSTSIIDSRKITLVQPASFTLHHAYLHLFPYSLGILAPSNCKGLALHLHHRGPCAIRTPSLPPWPPQIQRPLHGIFDRFLANVPCLSQPSQRAHATHARKVWRRSENGPECLVLPTASSHQGYIRCRKAL